MDKRGEKQWHEKTTAERLRAFAFCMPNVIAKLFYEAADELEELLREVAQARKEGGRDDA
ncbi:MAG TPA: hypothetical protein PKB13_07495 [Clostridia bacterium]|nr:hypothetical protein [Clostridia bacterium]